jgi:hypothetical protein
MRTLPAVLMALLVAPACQADPRGATPAASKLPGSRPTGGFTDRAREAGLDFVHFNGMSGQLSMVEIMAPGVALFDYDNDGDLDAYVTQGQPLDPARSEGAARPAGLEDRLYRNDSRVGADGALALRFTDVTGASRIQSRGYGMGVAAGDIDNDGWIDLYLTKFGAPNQLLRNNGDGTFADVSAKSGTDHRSWSVSAAFVDIDRDGWLDLYVANYLRYTVGGHPPCFSAAGAVDYCTPGSFAPLPDRLFHNNRDGTFTDITAPSRIATEFGPALGVVAADFDGDGWPDIYVANDGQENQLWINRHDRTFENRALVAGVALPAHGRAEASMGIDAADLDGDGDDDLFVTELTGEGSNLFLNDGTGLFEDRSAASGVEQASLRFTGFGTGSLDVDNDGRLDLLTVNGTIQMIEALRRAGDPFPLHQRKLLLRNTGAGRFEDLSERAGASLAQSDVGRGAAFGDIDNDGDVDVLVGNNNGPLRLLVNEGTAAHWIGLRLVDARGRRDMLGARVQVIRGDGVSLWRRARADGSYASASDPRVLAGLAHTAASPEVRVSWPDGRIETWTGLPIDRYTVLRQGTAR